MFTKFLKRYLGVPFGTYNGLVHYVTGTVPLCHSLNLKIQNAFLNINYPSCVNGFQLNAPEVFPSFYYTFEHVPSFFWFSPVLNFPLPCNPEVRRALLYDAFDLHHLRICSIKGHHSPDIACVCQHCGYAAERYHFRRCPAIMFKSPCGRLKFLMSVEGS